MSRMLMSRVMVMVIMMYEEMIDIAEPGSNPKENRFVGVVPKQQLLLKWVEVATNISQYAFPPPLIDFFEYSHTEVPYLL